MTLPTNIPIIDTDTRSCTARGVEVAPAPGVEADLRRTPADLLPLETLTQACAGQRDVLCRAFGALLVEPKDDTYTGLLEAAGEYVNACDRVDAEDIKAGPLGIRFASTFKVAEAMQGRNPDLLTAPPVDTRDDWQKAKDAATEQAAFAGYQLSEFTNRENDCVALAGYISKSGLEVYAAAWKDGRFKVWHIPDGGPPEDIAMGNVRTQEGGASCTTN